MPTPDLLVLHVLLFPDGALPANFPNLILWVATEQLTGVQTGTAALKAGSLQGSAKFVNANLFSGCKWGSYGGGGGHTSACMVTAQR